MQRPFRFGVQVGRIIDPAAWTDLARRAEADGNSALMIPDHLGRLATFPALMAAAAVTSRIRLTTYVLNQDFRPPALLAVEASSVQLLTDNRLELGVGAGWAKGEYIQAGLHYDQAPERVARFDEYLQVVKGLLNATAPFSFTGRYYTLRDFQPLPHKTPPPILVGGGSRRVLSTGGRLADIMSIATRATPDSRIDARNLTLDQVEHKLAWIREAAGDRFDAIELNMTVRDVRITDDRRAAARELLSSWQTGRTMMANADALSEQDILDSPHIVLGTVPQIADQLKQQRERWNINYFEINSSDMDTLAPVVERL
jgi:probable F420-dependent oxidoreductase